MTSTQLSNQTMKLCIAGWQAEAAARDAEGQTELAAAVRTWIAAVLPDLSV
jgi:hypothetical protein